jgi:hypothetical protein
VNVIAVTMRVLMWILGLGNRIQASTKYAQVKPTQDHQHQGHAQFETQAKARGDNDSKKYDKPAHHEERQAVADSPEHPSQRGISNLSLPANNRGHGDYMIRIGGVAHAEKETESEDRE